MRLRVRRPIEFLYWRYGREGEGSFNQLNAAWIFQQRADAGVQRRQPGFVMRSQPRQISVGELLMADELLLGISDRLNNGKTIRPKTM